MEKAQMWTCVLMLFVTLQSRSGACRWLERYSFINKESLDLLERLGAERSIQRDSFPKKLYGMMDNAKLEDQLKFIALNLDHIVNLMNSPKHMSLVQWSPEIMEDFLSSLHRQLDEIKHCVTQHPESKNKDVYEKKLKNHYKKLKRNLKRKKYSAAKWEEIRQTVKTHLEMMELMVNYKKQRV